MTNFLVLLERFDAPIVKRAPTLALTAPNPNAAREEHARAEGYANGLAAGKATATTTGAEDARLLAAVAAALEAQTTAARGVVAAEAGAALQVILERLFPKLSEAGFAVEAAAAFAKAAGAGPDLAIEIAAPPDQAEAIKDWLGRFAPDGKFSFRSDPSMNGGAQAFWTGGGADFDFKAAVDQCLTALKDAAATLSNGDDV